MIDISINNDIIFPFHTLSENNIADKDGNLAVVGVMFEEGKEQVKIFLDNVRVILK